MGVPKSGSALNRGAGTYLEKRGITAEPEEKRVCIAPPLRMGNAYMPARYAETPSRRYWRRSGGLELFFGRPKDFPKLIASEAMEEYNGMALDAGIAGLDQLLEFYCEFVPLEAANRAVERAVSPEDGYVPPIAAEPLGFGGGRVVLAVKEDEPPSEVFSKEPILVACSEDYANIAKRWLERSGIFTYSSWPRRSSLDEALLMPVLGSAEGVEADVYVDFEGSGETLEDNGLRRLATLFESDAALLSGLNARNDEVYCGLFGLECGVGVQPKFKNGERFEVEVVDSKSPAGKLYMDNFSYQLARATLCLGFDDGFGEEFYDLKQMGAKWDGWGAYAEFEPWLEKRKKASL